MAHEILIVDDEADIRSLTAGILSDEGYQSREAANSNSALAAVESRRPTVVLLDIWLQGSELDGLGILHALKEDYPEIPVVMMSGHGTIETAVASIQDGAFDFIEKPFKVDRMIHVVERAIETARLRRENAELSLRAGREKELLGFSAPINQVRQILERVAPTNSRVLFSGPPGSGKEVAGRMLHGLSRRASGPFVVVNCAIMAPDRVEMELFGCEPGYGPGPRVGLFEAAHNGTLLFDEVADMPLETQGKVVRVLQEQTFSRMGGDTRVEVDVRVVAATNRDLSRLIGDGAFRQDLFYRLSVVPVEIPALLARRDDILFLAEHFMARAAATAGHPPRTFGDDALAALQAYSWPGNVRELRNVVERLLILAPGSPADPIRADMLPAEIGAIAPAALNWDSGGTIMTMPLRDAREVFEREYLMAQVTRFGGNISKTAEFVGMERSALHRKLRNLGVLDGERRRAGRR